VTVARSAYREPLAVVTTLLSTRDPDPEAVETTIRRRSRS
jgi:hypothetical protein